MLWSHYHSHKTHKNSHTLIGWLLDGNRKGQSLYLSWRNMASEWKVRFVNGTAASSRLLLLSFPQHRGTRIHKVDLVREQHGCSTSRRSHGQDTRRAEVCAIVTLYITGALVHSYTYLSRNSCCEWLFISRENVYFCWWVFHGKLDSLNVCLLFCEYLYDFSNHSPGHLTCVTNLLFYLCCLLYCSCTCFPV